MLKIKTINTVHNYLHLLPQPIVIFKDHLSLLVTERSKHWKFHGKRNLFRSLSVNTLAHKRLWHSRVKKECLQSTFFFPLPVVGHCFIYTSVILNKKSICEEEKKINVDVIFYREHTCFSQISWLTEWRPCMNVWEYMCSVLLHTSTATYCT